MSGEYRTTDLPLASYLKMKGFRPEIELHGRKATFIFVGSTKEAVKNFYGGDGDFFMFNAHSRGLKSQVENLMKGGNN